jgi:hypothetical protein
MLIHMRALLAILLAVAASSCAPNLDFPVPTQKVMPRGPEPGSSPLLRMSEPRINAHIVAGVVPDDPGSHWRWTNQHARFRISLDGARDWSFHAQFTVPAVVLARLHSITLDFIVNEHKLGSRTYDAEGTYEFTTPVPATLLPDPTNITFGLDADRAYIAERDSTKLCVLIEAIGFRKDSAR